MAATVYTCILFQGHSMLSGLVAVWAQCLIFYFSDFCYVLLISIEKSDPTHITATLYLYNSIKTLTHS